MQIRVRWLAIDAVDSESDAQLDRGCPARAVFAQCWLCWGGVLVLALVLVLVLVLVGTFGQTARILRAAFGQAARTLRAAFGQNVSTVRAAFPQKIHLFLLPASICRELFLQLARSCLGFCLLLARSCLSFRFTTSTTLFQTLVVLTNPLRALCVEPARIRPLKEFGKHHFCRLDLFGRLHQQATIENLGIERERFFSLVIHIPHVAVNAALKTRAWPCSAVEVSDVMRVIDHGVCVFVPFAGDTGAAYATRSPAISEGMRR